MVLIFRKHLAPASPLEEQQTTADKTPTPSGELWWKATFVGSSCIPAEGVNTMAFRSDVQIDSH